MVVVGPEDPLVLGIHDYFNEDDNLKNIPVIGPEKAAAAVPKATNRQNLPESLKILPDSRKTF